MVALRVMALLVGLLLMAVAGCGRMSGTGDGNWDFRSVDLSELPPEAKAVRERLKMVPGAYALEQGSQTYLLLCAGRMASPELGLEVLEVRPLPGSAREARVLAAVYHQPGAAAYPCAAVAVEGAEGFRFKARISTGGEKVLELHSTAVSADES